MDFTMERKTVTRSVSSNRPNENNKDVKLRTGGVGTPGAVPRGADAGHPAAVPRKNKNYKTGRGGYYGGSARKTKGKDSKQVDDVRQQDALKENIDDYVSYMEKINQNGKERSSNDGPCIATDSSVSTIARDHDFNTSHESNAGYANVRSSCFNNSVNPNTEWSDYSADDWLDANIEKFEDMRQNGSRRKPSLKIITDKGHHNNQSKGSRFDRNYSHQYGSNHSHGGQHKNYKKNKGPQVKATRERLLQARCKFLLNPKIAAQHQATQKLPVGCVALDIKESTELNEDPDSIIPWAAVEQVTMQLNDLPNCPICLYPPTAPQITRCGHVYCYACVLHTLALTDDNWVKCPICEQPVVGKDLKSVVVTLYPLHPVGSSVRLTLMALAPGASVAVPVEDPEMPPLVPRCAPANRSVVEDIVALELKALEVKMTLEAGEPEVIFIEQALALVRERSKRIPLEYPSDFDDVSEGFAGLSLDGAGEQKCKKSTTKLNQEATDKNSNLAMAQEGSGKKSKNRRNRKPKRSLGVEFESVFDAPPPKSPELGCNMTSELTLAEDGSVLASVVRRSSLSSDDHGRPEIGDCSEGSMVVKKQLQFSEDSKPSIEGICEEKNYAGASCANIGNNATKSNVTTNNNGTVYFYQASDGSNIYLLPLNMAMLMHTYGSAERLPATITATVLEKDCCVVSASSRQRCKQLRTLPLCCPYELVECEVAALVAEGTRREFRAPLTRRKEIRDERGRAERMIERRNAAQYERELSGVLYARVYSATATAGATSAATNAAAAAVVVEAAGDVPDAPQVSTSQTNSFAKIVRHGPAPSTPAPSALWPSLSSVRPKRSLAPPSALAWGAPAPPTAPPPTAEGSSRKRNKKSRK